MSKHFQNPFGLPPIPNLFASAPPRKKKTPFNFRQFGKNIIGGAKELFRPTLDSEELRRDTKTGSILPPLKSTPFLGPMSPFKGGLPTTKVGGFTIPSSPFGLTPDKSTTPPISAPATPLSQPFNNTQAIPQVTTQTAPTATTAPISTPIPRTPSGMTEQEALAIQSTQKQATGVPEQPITGPATTTKPNIPPETTKAVSLAEKILQDSLIISPEALSTQENIDKLIESTNKAFINIQDQPIPLEFITGQLASVERRALGLAEPLERKLARLQASRLASVESSKFALDRADKKAQIARDDANRKTPDTGFTLGEKQTRFDKFGKVIARGIGVSNGTNIGGVGFEGISDEAQNWADLIDSGQAKFSDIKDENLRSQVASTLRKGSASKKEQESQVLNEKITLINNLIKHPGLNSRVGPSLPFFPDVTRRTLNPFAITDIGGAGQDFAAGVHKFAGKLALDNLIAVKARGATFGALQKAELDLLIQAASKIGDWEIKNKQGEGIGEWNIDEVSFKRELKTIKTLTEKAIGNVGGKVDVNQGLSEEDELRSQGYSEEQIQIIKNS